ncbi:MAG: hypothetical protein IKS96_07875 [Fibrobacter sp.]|nr:hypothetical protein [Fibrobacter sp.]
MKNEETILKACKEADKDMEKFGIEYGFPVIFVVERMKNELDEISENKFKFTFFKKDQMHEAAQFAKKYDGELGVFDPKLTRPCKGNEFKSPEEQKDEIKKWLKDCRETNAWDATERYLGIKKSDE